MPLAAGAAPWSSCPSGPWGSLLGAAMSEAARGHRKGGHTGSNCAHRARGWSGPGFSPPPRGCRTRALKLSGNNCDRAKTQDTWVHTLVLPNSPSAGLQVSPFPSEMQILTLRLGWAPGSARLLSTGVRWTTPPGAGCGETFPNPSIPEVAHPEAHSQDSKRITQRHRWDLMADVKSQTSSQNTSAPPPTSLTPRHPFSFSVATDTVGAPELRHLTTAV